MSERALLVAVVCAACVVGSGPAFAAAKLPYRQLTLSDFPTRSIDSPYDAVTRANLEYNYTEHWNTVGDRWRSQVTAMRIECFFDPTKSWKHAWVRRPEATIMHEQGHFDVCQRKVVQLRGAALADYPMGSGTTAEQARADLAARLAALFDVHITAMSREQKRYDRETEHGRNPARQAAWNRTFASAGLQ